jgi:predicted dehydrogenase
MPVKIGFIGSGGIAGAHVSGLKKNADAQLVAFSDVQEERAARFAAETGAKVFTDWKKMLDTEQLDAVYICLPPHVHGAPELGCIERKLPFLVEKPISNDMETATNILGKARRAKVMTAVGYMNRYRRSLQRGKELLAGAKISSLEGHWLGGTPGVGWWYRKAQSGGQLVEQTTHIVDSIVYLAGRVVEVYAVGARGTHANPPDGYDVEDATAITLKFANGAVGSVNSACSLKAGGGVGLDVYSPSVVLSYRDWNMSLKAVKSASESEDVRGEDNIFEIEDRAFVQAVATKNESLILCNYAQAFHAHHVTMAANHSLETGAPVRLPDFS